MKNKNTYIAVSMIVVSVLVLSIGIYAYSRKKSLKDIKSILFIGDSNTAANFSYADQLKKKFPSLRIKKISQNGAKTDWGLSELKNELKNNKYDAVSILMGSNDIYGLNKNDSAKANLEAMYKLAHDNGAFVIGITPPNKDFYVSKTDKKQELLSDLVNWMKKDNNIDLFINFYDITKNKSFFTELDGYLHPQNSAHKILTDNVSSKLNLA